MFCIHVAKAHNLVVLFPVPKQLIIQITKSQRKYDMKENQ